MGYGHERAAFGLEDLAHGGILTANDYPGIPEEDKRLWAQTRGLYETISRLRPVPGVGPLLFGAMDHFQQIPAFYPRRDLSHPNLQLRQIYRLIEQKGLGRHLVETLAAKKHLPFISTFFIPAFAAEVHGYPGEIFLVCCDADVSRTWAPRDPKKSRINYFAPNGRVVERLKLYGVPSERIFLTGFPLPKAMIGGPESTIVKKDLASRICNLDPQGIFISKYHETLTQTLGPTLCKFKPTHPLTLTFTVGGAGAQKELGITAMRSLKKRILSGQLRMQFEAGTRREVAIDFLDAANRFGLKRALGKTLNVNVYRSRAEYFRGFAKTLRTTDVLWTKPSELSFYTGLGIPIIIAPPIGSQEEFNKLWLMTVNGGIPQNDPEYTDEWLFDYIASGGLARFAWNGFIEAPTHGTYRIEHLMTGEPTPLAELPLIV